MLGYSLSAMRAQADSVSILQSSTGKTAGALPPGTLQRTLAIIMGGGAGSRLFPLTKDRAKPAVPIGGKYRIVDIPISNCLNSGLRSIYVLTQFNSMSLHRHIQASYKFDNFSRSFIDILAAQQTPEGSQWYQGTADAVRQNMRYFLEGPFDYYLILSGDQLYRMDFRTLLHQHIQSGADITLATKPIHRHQVAEFGIMQSGVDRRIVRFDEKPKDDSILQELKMSRELLRAVGSKEDEELFQASMGIYLFNRDVLVKCLDNDLFDFGKDIIPRGATIRNSVIMGADYFEHDRPGAAGVPPIGVGRNCVVDRAIIDKNARIADGVVITPEGKAANLDADNYFIRDGIVVVPKNAVIPAGVWI